MSPKKCIQTEYRNLSEEALKAMARGEAALCTLGGPGEEGAGYKGYGYAMFVELLSAALQGGHYGQYLTGKDENGNDWELSAKSLFCSLILSAQVQHRAHTAHEVDWNTIWCECEKDIYHLIGDFVKE